MSFSLSFSSHFITCEKDTCLTDVTLCGFLFVSAMHIICVVCCDVFLFLHLCVQYVCQPAVKRSRLQLFFDLTLTQDVDSGVRAECWHQKTICHMKQSLFNQYQHFFCFASKSHAEKVNVFSGCSSCKRRYNCFTFRGLIFLREFLKIPHLFVLFCTKCGLICLGLATMLSSLHSLLTQQPCTPPSHSSSCL